MDARIKLYHDASIQKYGGALLAWADSCTDSTSARRADLLRDKVRALADFVRFVDKPFSAVTPGDVKKWQMELEGRGLSPATIYSRVSRVSAFFEWALRSGRYQIATNPVAVARPKSPRPYSSESTKSLTDEELRALLAAIRARADIVGLRDYALALFFISTGARRSEIVSLRWADIRLESDHLIVTFKIKGGSRRAREIRDSRVRDALLDYLRADGRLASMTPNSPLWVRHDIGAQPGTRVTSHGVAKAFKGYADSAGLDEFHLHQLRHTHARILGDESGSMAVVQESLNHANEATTRIYLAAVAIQRDAFSSQILARVVDVV